MSHPKRVLVPSKTFLCGEYAVLKNFKALLLSHEPCFSCSLDSEGENPASIKFHPESPAGRLEVKLVGKQQNWVFEDPHGGAGGFGGSTAEFIGVYKSLKPEGSFADAMESYNELFKDQMVSPSGADLAAQYSGDLGLTVFTKDSLSTEGLEWPFKKHFVLILKTDTKLETHKHLNTLAFKEFTRLGEASENAIEALISNQGSDFLEALETFSFEQAYLSLLSKESAATVAEIKEIEGVSFARGCGAMGADVIAVFVKKESLDYVWSQIEGLDKGLKRVV